MNKAEIVRYSELKDRKPVHALVSDVDLVIIRFDDQVSVLYGRCAHRGALMSDGYIDGDNLICGVHYWDYRLDSGISEYNHSESLHKFSSWIKGDNVLIDEDEIANWSIQNPQPYNRSAYQGVFQDHTGTTDEPHVKLIRQLASFGLSKTGAHGPSAAMGVSRNQLPSWMIFSSLLPSCISFHSSMMCMLIQNW